MQTELREHTLIQLIVVPSIECLLLYRYSQPSVVGVALRSHSGFHGGVFAEEGAATWPRSRADCEVIYRQIGHGVPPLQLRRQFKLRRIMAELFIPTERLTPINDHHLSGHK